MAVQLIGTADASYYESYAGRVAAERRDLETTIKRAVSEYAAIYRQEPTQAELNALWRTSVMVAAFAEFRADNVAQVPFKVLNENDQEPPADHVLSRLFRRRFADTVRRVELCLQYGGSALLHKKRNFRGEWSRLQWLNPNLWRIDVSSGGLAGFKLYSGGWGYEGVDEPDRYVSPEDAVYMHEFSFESDFEGVGWVERAFNAAASEEEMSLTVLAFMRNRAVPLLLIMPAEKGGNTGATDEERRDLDRFSAMMRDSVKGSGNAGKTVITPDRWEAREITIRFDQAAMPELYNQIQENISVASHIPLSLVMSDKASYADGYGQEQRWLSGWLIPRAEWYAEWLTEAVQDEYGFKWRVVADTEEVGKRVASLKTERVLAQVQGGTRDVYSAQVEMGIEPDQRLKGVYIVGGVPTRVEDFAAGRFDTGSASGGSLLSLTGSDSEGSLPPRPEVGKSVDGAALKAVFDELAHRAPQEGKARDCAFSPVSVPPDTAAAVRLWLRALPAHARDVAFDEGRAHYVAYHASAAAKAYAATETKYRAVLTDLISSAFEHRSGEPVVSRKQFGDLGRAEIRTHFTQVFIDGLREAGVVLGDASELDEEEQAQIKALRDEEARRWTKLADELYRDVLPQRDVVFAMYERADLARQRGDEAESQRFMQLAETNFASFRALQRGFIDRVGMWVNKGLARVFEMGKLAGDANQMMEWVLGKTEQHCRTCLVANGQRHRAKDWQRAGIIPKTDRLECGGFYCDCRLVPVPGERARGRLDRIPLAG